MQFLFAAITSFFITTFAIPPTIIFAKRFKLLDNPLLRPHPAHTQQRTVPRAGGLAIYIGLLVAILFFTSLNQSTIGILASLTILLVIGLLDDRYQNLSPYLRLISQFLAAIILVLSGVGINFITNPLGGIIHLNNFQLVPQLLAVIWIVWVMNMINWSKGVDGQMPGIVTIAAIVLGLLSLKLNHPQALDQINVAKLSFITAGASAGLLIFNWHPAKIFPGFSGSTILGFMIAVLAILSGAKLATAGLVLLIPATDFTYTFMRRVLHGKSPVWGDRGHLHHKLLEQGLTHQQISLFYIFGSVILGFIALSLSSQGKLFAASLVAAILLGAILWLNFFGGLSKQSDPSSG
ncbi:undecaprenyl/decaprenyl-phosphate alpha-N-acetylglucosaminyl 1-phosphate transferase [Candidatus Daviesbacteria bacterium]|nr:undecaprenyl/decaprenyl-phosphate alpha-N-acetylglucosaminyl 1-phosphate transferase [Candidatus Daviesbacteria bacterium]